MRIPRPLHVTFQFGHPLFSLDDDNVNDDPWTSEHNTRSPRSALVHYLVPVVQSNLIPCSLSSPPQTKGQGLVDWPRAALAPHLQAHSTRQSLPRHRLQRNKLRVSDRPSAAYRSSSVTDARQ
jgi:hypothetical protein